MIVLDTNIISELANERAAPAFRAWAQSRSREELFLCTPVIAEIVFGAELFQLRTGSLKHTARLGDLIEKQFLFLSKKVSDCVSEEDREDEVEEASFCICVCECVFLFSLF